MFTGVICILPRGLRFKAIFQWLFGKASESPFGGLWGGDGFEAVIKRAFEGTYIRVIRSWFEAWQRTDFLGRDLDCDQGNHFLLWARGWGRCATIPFLVAD